jgi:DNA mismatch repair protein MutL
VHPAKAEVRFKSQDRVFSFVQRAARRALLAYTPVPSLPTATLWGGAMRPPERGEPREPGMDWTMAAEADVEGAPARPQEPAPAGTPTTQPGIPPIPLMRLVGQIGSTYLVAEGPDGLYLIDQHAAHERVLFEKLMAQAALKNVPAQALLSPAVVHLPPAQAKLIEAQLDALGRFGFEVEPFGANAFQVRSMPVLFESSDPSLALRALVEDFEEDETPLQAEVEAKLAGRVCKRLAVKAGQALTTEEQRALLTNLEACESPRTCPHGRPTMIHLSVDMLERQFGRRGAR